jgi:hypothetical protein
MKYNKNLSCLYFVGVSLKKSFTAALNIGCKHTTNDWIIFASIKIKETIKCGDRKSYQYIPSDKFLFVQFFITTNIEFSNDFNCTFLWISITFTIGFTDKIILKRRIHWLNKIQIRKSCYHSCDQISQFFLINLSITGNIIPKNRKLNSKKKI